MQKDPNQNTIKVCFLGICDTGKTSILSRAGTGAFSQNYESTVGAGFSVLTSRCGKYKFECWDTSGKERFRSLTPMYLRGSQIVVYVFSSSNTKSFSELPDFIEMRRNAVADDMLIGELIIGNKNDLPRLVPIGEAEDFAQNNRCMYLDMNCSSGNYTQAFLQKLKELADKHHLMAH